MQLHQLLMGDPIAKGLKQALIEDISPTGLSQTSRARVREILGDEPIGNRLTRGPRGQRGRIYDTLGYVESKEQTFRPSQKSP